jgi:cytochrome c oxidase subunit 2
MFFIILRHFSYQIGHLTNKSITPEEISDWFIISLVKKNIASQNINHNSNLEIIWVILPAIVLVCIAIPSFTILYTMDEVFNPSVIIKVIGHQWYWSYEYTPFYIGAKHPNYDACVGIHYPPVDDRDMQFDSLLVDTLGIKKWFSDELTIKNYKLRKWYIGLKSLRLLLTDNQVFLPTKTHIQILVTSEDVIHSWAVPSLGIKIDCVPGRLNQVSLYIKRSGYFYGQCSEICGINHGFMPIQIVAVPSSTFLKWILY